MKCGGEKKQEETTELVRVLAEMPPPVVVRKLDLRWRLEMNAGRVVQLS